MISGMNRTKSRRGQPNTALTVHGLLTIHGPNLNGYANVAKCKNVLNIGYINLSFLFVGLKCCGSL